MTRLLSLYIMSGHFVLLIGLISLLVSGTWSYCFRSPPLTEFRNGVVHTYCELKGKRYELGTHFKNTNECYECYCEKDAMGCCGYGIHAGVYNPMPGCQVVAHECQPYMVKIDEPTKDCMSGHEIDILG